MAEDGQHSTRSVLNWVKGSASEGWYWRADANYNTLIGIFNTDSEEATVDVSLSYEVNGQQKSYELPTLTIPPRVAELVDVGNVISSEQPDADGDVIPVNATFGGYSVNKVGRRLNKALTTETLLVNRRTKTFETFYNTCCSRTSPQFSPASFLFQPEDTGQMTTSIYDLCAGQYIDVTTSADYWTNNASIATVGATTGAAAGVSPGSTNLWTEISYFQMVSFLGPCEEFTEGDSTGANVKPVNTGPTNTLWWFQGLQLGVSGYTTEITLTASSGSSYIWNVVSGSDKITLSGSGAQVTVTAIGKSSTANDVSVTVTVAGQTSDPFRITVRAPFALGVDPLNPSPGYFSDPTYVWESRIPYQIRDNFLVAMPIDLPINEHWTTSVVNDYAGTDWRRPAEGCVTAVAFYDGIMGETPSRTPTPVYNANQNGPAVQHWGQEWRVGTCQIGSGPRVQLNTLQKYTDHAAHTGITTPAP